MKRNILLLFIATLISCQTKNDRSDVNVQKKLECDTNKSYVFNNDLEIITKEESIKFVFTEPYQNDVEYSYVLYKFNGSCYVYSQSRNYYLTSNGVTYKSNNDSLIKSYRKITDCKYLNELKKPLDSIVKLLHERDNSNSVKHYKTRIVYNDGLNNYDFDYNNLSLSTMNYLDSIILSLPVFNDQLGAETYTRTNFRR